MTTTRAATARVERPQIVVLTAVWVVAAVGHIAYGNPHHFFDFKIYYRAARWWARGHDLYSFSQADRIEGSLAFTYPPFAAVVMRPLAALPVNAALAIFVTISVASLLVAVWCLVAPVAIRHGYPAWYGVALAFPVLSWLEPIRETFGFGQVNFILAALVVVDLLVAVPRGSRWAGVGIGLAAAIKLTPAIFVLYLLLTRRWRPALTAMATAVGVTLAGAALMWNDAWRFWTELLWDTERIGRIDRVQNQSLMGALARVLHVDHPNQLAWALLAIAILGYGLWRARTAALSGDEVVGLTLTGLVGSLVSPVTWSHHLFWFAPALVVLVDAALDRRDRGRRWLIGLAVTLYVTVTFSVITWYDWHVVPRRSFDKGVPGFLIDNWYTLLMLALLFALPVRRRPLSFPAAAPQPNHAELVSEPR
jgi:alpha-1,2-mannosyltransferase